MSKAKSALWYRRHLGWSIIPLHSVREGACTCGRPGCSSPGKHPIAAALPGGSWAPFQRQPATLEQLVEWWLRWPWANVGLITGAVSGVFVLDVDPRHGGDGSLNNLQAEHGILPATVEANTGGGGFHLFFRHPGRPVKNAVNIAPGIDIRGDGGLIVLAPSDHASGGRYVWGELTKPNLVEVAEAPGWLLDMVLDKPRPVAHVGARTTTDEWARLILEGAHEGERNVSATKLAGLLLRAGLNPAVVAALVLVWNRHNTPPLPEAEILRTVESVAAREAHKRAVKPA